jgi:hypothetical protein
MLKKVVKSLFLWAKDNVVVFNDSKTELIHFNKNKEIIEFILSECIVNVDFAWFSAINSVKYN